MDNIKKKDNKVYIISLIIVIIFALWGIIGPTSFVPFLSKKSLVDGKLFMTLNVPISITSDANVDVISIILLHIVPLLSISNFAIPILAVIIITLFNESISYFTVTSIKLMAKKSRTTLYANAVNTLIMVSSPPTAYAFAFIEAPEILVIP